jgi:hypothetical protein
MASIKIEGTEYPIVFRMKAVGIYQDLTGEKLIGNASELTQIFGGETEDKTNVSIDANKFMALVQAVLMNGNPKLKADEAEEIAGMVDFADTNVYSSLASVFKRSETEKNAEAPEAGA